jgi:hypothetical protein
VVGGGNDERYSRDDRGLLRRIYSERVKDVGFSAGKLQPFTRPAKNSQSQSRTENGTVTKHEFCPISNGRMLLHVTTGGKPS